MILDYPLALRILIFTSIALPGGRIFDSLAILILVTVLACRRSREAAGILTAFLLIGTCAVTSYIYNWDGFIERMPFLTSVMGMDSDLLFEKAVLLGLLTLAMLPTCFMLGTIGIRRESEMQSFVRTILIAGGLNALITSYYWIKETGGAFSRYNFIPPIEGSQGLHLDCMLVVSIIAITCLVLRAGTLADRRLQAIVLGLCGISIASVMVRQSWVAFAITALLAVILCSRWLPPATRKRHIIVAAIAISLFGAATVLMYDDQVSEMFSEVSLSELSDAGTGSGVADESGISLRVTLAQHGLDVFSEHPLFGVGYGLYPAYSTVPVFISGTATYVASPHNAIVAFLAEDGVIGTAFILFTLAFTVRMCWIAWRSATGPFSSSLAAAVMAILIVMIPLHLISNSLLLPPPPERAMVQHACCLWMLLGAMVGSASPSRLRNWLQ